MGFTGKIRVDFFVPLIRRESIGPRTPPPSPYQRARRQRHCARSVAKVFLTGKATSATVAEEHGGRRIVVKGTGAMMTEAKEHGAWLVDTHAHLDFPELFGDLDGVFERCRAAGVAVVVTIGIDEKTSRTAVELSRRYSHVYATVGLHPHGARRLSDRDADTFVRLATEPKVVALGEMGLDYYRDRQPRPVQRACLEQQLELAVRCDKPAVFHIREAHEDFLKIVTPYAGRLRPSVLHCFSGDWATALRCLELGFYLSIPGTVTYKNAQEQQRVVRMAPLDRLLVETDAPYLTPVPFRGRPNEPSYVRCTAEKIAELRGCSFEEVAWATTRNAERVFGWGKDRGAQG